jgi:hypothetical protein
VEFNVNESIRESPMPTSILPSDEWDQIVELIRRYSLRRYGDAVLGISLHLQHLGDVREVFPFPGRVLAGRDPPAQDPYHTSDFQLVIWHGERYTFSPKQRAVVARLWAAWEKGWPGINQQQLLRAADSDAVRLADLFKRCPAWGKMIVSIGPGLYSLSPPPEEQEQKDGCEEQEEQNQAQ